ncbi:hypothetical protein B0H17DRAFT_1190185 [Mycena rosella]|uniref:Uncharacterized protein n=1 Tax=Mycena rosella TaxID=1033263 RepID=A0AAD7H1Y2_MYCRO|nr:hypothetical protein B0H17DRAFT_1190185 [Mycena rosella]
MSCSSSIPIAYRELQLAPPVSRSPENTWFGNAVRKPLKAETAPINQLPGKRWMTTEAERLALEAFTDALRRRDLLSSQQKKSRNARKREGFDSPTDAAGSEYPGARQSIFATRKPQAHQVFRAIEDQDLSLLAEIAEYGFGLLLRPLSAGTNRTPLNHAIDCGVSHRGVALLLLGMFSRYVNHLSDADFAEPAARETLRLLRVNFAFATARGILHADHNLAASFLQLVISLRGTTPGEPVALADRAMRRYAGRTVKTHEIIAALEDYIGNATADLLMMAAWQAVCEGAPEPLSLVPTYYFARDERVLNAFAERLDQHRELIEQCAGRRLRAQLAVLRESFGGRATTNRAKVGVVDRRLSELCGKF